MRSVIVFSFLLALVYAAPPSDNNNNVYEVDLEPEEAQKYIKSPPFSDPTLSLKVADLPLIRASDPKFRSADAGPTNGHYWKNGKEIENTEDYVEEVYNAAQFHGQDGLGLYAYGYKTPESSKVENREHNGDVSGSYVFRDGNDNLIKVRYWADSEGFHQEDNLPKPVLPEGPTETPEVREARLAHQQAWEEAAAAAAQAGGGESPDYDEQHQGAASENQDTVAAPNNVRQAKAFPGAYQGNQQQRPGSYQQQPQASYQQQSGYKQPQASYPANIQQSLQQQSDYQQAPQGQFQTKPPQNIYQQQGGPQQKPQGSYQQQSSFQQQASYQQKPQGSAQQGSYQQFQQSSYGQSSQQQGSPSPKQQQNEEEYSTEYPPKGFFYSFEYPVSVLKNINEKSPEQQGQGQYSSGAPVDQDTVGVSGSYRG